MTINLRRAASRLNPFHRGYEAGYADAALVVLGMPYPHPDGGHVFPAEVEEITKEDATR